MRADLLAKLEQISDEERKLLSGGTAVDWSYYIQQRQSVVALDRLVAPDKLLAVRTHTRFVDFPDHRHDYVEMMYVCAGTITHVIQGKEIVMHQGDLLFLSPQTLHSIRRAGEKDIGLNFIVRPSFFDTPLQMLSRDSALARFLVDTIRSKSQKSQYLHFELQGIPAIENLMENIISSVMEDHQGEDDINKITMGLVFLHAMNHIDRLNSASPHSYQDTILMTTLRYIDTRFQDANLSELAAELHQSLSVLSRMIKHEMGCTFQDLVQRKRFQNAVALLVETDLSIADIMNACGYANSSYFYRKFKEKYHLTPREYRDQRGKQDTILV